MVSLGKFIVPIPGSHKAGVETKRHPWLLRPLTGLTWKHLRLARLHGLGF